MQLRMRRYRPIKRNPEYYFEKGVSFYDDGEVSRAINFFLIALHQNYLFIDARYYLGLCYYTEEKYKEAENVFTKVLELAPRHIDAYIRRSRAFYLQGEYDAAISDANEAIKLNPDCDPGYHARAVANYNLHEYDKAILDMNISIRINPNKALYFSNRGKVYYEKKQYDQALSDFAEALRLNPDFAIHDSVLEHCFSFCTELSGISTDALFNLIKLLPEVHQQFPLLKKCLVEGNPLGDLMWDADLGEGCNNFKGTLKDIYDYINLEIDPAFTLPNPMASVRTCSIFKPVARQVDNLEESLKKENNIPITLQDARL